LPAYATDDSRRTMTAAPPNEAPGESAPLILQVLRAAMAAGSYRTAVRLGANAYIVKGATEWEGLLEGALDEAQGGAGYSGAALRQPVLSRCRIRR